MNDDVTQLNPGDPLLARARNLEKEVPPPRDLWPEIESRMNQPAQGTFSKLKLAAAAVVLVGVSSVVTLLLSETTSTSGSPAMVGIAAPDFMHAEYTQTKTDLLLALEEELDQLSPEDRKVLAKNLTDIDEAMAEINTAMAGNPNSDLLLQLLLSTYTDQLNLMGDMHELTRSVNERTGI